MKMGKEYFKDGTAIVTGAGSGLGASMVTRFASQGMAIAALDIDQERVNAVVQEVCEAGGQAIGLKVDVGDPASLDAAAKEVEDAFGGATVVCANVGVQQFGAIDKLTEQDWRWVLDVNVLGTVRTVGAFLPLLRRSAGNRHILITASSGALTPGIRMGAYTTSKYAVLGYAETLRVELEAEGIGVSTLFPAGMITRHLESSRLARPAELGPSELRREDIDMMMASRKINAANHVATPDHATRHLLADLEANERFIITHGNYRDTLVATHEQILRAHVRAQEN